MYKGNEKDPKLFESLLKEVLDFLGHPLSATSLMELAKSDTLDVIYTDLHLPQADPVLTRSKAAGKLDLAKAYHLVQAHDDADIPRDEEIDEFDTHLSQIPPKELQRSRQLHTILEEEWKKNKKTSLSSLPTSGTVNINQLFYPRI